MNVATIPAVPGARHRKKRVGRGIGSGHGKTATRGQKGQRARTGSGKRPGFEGGRTPLIRRLPKRGFRYKATGRPLAPELVNVRQLNRFEEGERVTPERLRAVRLIGSPHRRVKLLGDGELTKRLTVVVHQASRSATAKVEQAGGTVERITDRHGIPAQ
jgi:large subunit ribosomal protein L15